MSSKDIAIKVENISKIYRIGVKENMHDSFARTMFDFIKSPLRNYRKYRSLYKFDEINSEDGRNSNSSSSDIVWALKNVSFEVQRGEALGIIGSNGAGKSTILKILCRITDPTSGRSEIRGRVSSLLEVGTGFHPELTGRENVYLNGTILGMTKKEVDSKFDEIVDFSGVERFIDTPVKRYSSGMKVRLAFAVAAHLEPEILIIDEVLAVGDSEFQKKCLGKMGEVAKEGRTILFVSHNMGAIGQLCGRVLLLEGGQVKLTGTSAAVISSYLLSGAATHSTWSNTATRLLDVEVYVESARVLLEDNIETSVVEFDRQFKVEIAYKVIDPTRSLIILCRLSDSLGNAIWTSWDSDSIDWDGRVRKPGRYRSLCNVPGSWLRPDRYLLSIGAFINNVKEITYHENVLTFDVSPVGSTLNENRIGIVRPVFKWEVEQVNGTD
jgi:lipopolysaccharide transport system ATP-binding protein